jgi:hypothetical protein
VIERTSEIVLQEIGDENDRSRRLTLIEEFKRLHDEELNKSMANVIRSIPTNIHISLPVREPKLRETLEKQAEGLKKAHAKLRSMERPKPDIRIAIEERAIQEWTSNSRLSDNRLAVILKKDVAKDIPDTTLRRWVRQLREMLKE